MMLYLTEEKHVGNHFWTKTTLQLKFTDEICKQLLQDSNVSQSALSYLNQKIVLFKLKV